MHIGFTGTQQGMTAAQVTRLEAFFVELRADAGLDNEGLVFHHGDCIGADAQAQIIAKMCGLTIHSYPAIESGNGGKRAHTSGNDYIHEPKEPLKRNVDIVATSDLLIAAPYGFTEEVRRSGTWATVRYARKKPIRVWIIWPDGNWRKESTL